MKKYIFLTLFFVCIASNVISQQFCCPEFKIVTKHIKPCDQNECRDTATKGDAANKPIEKSCACRNQPQEYLVEPNLPGFMFSWTVVGGTVVTSPANPATINWGNGTDGYIQVIITNADGSCRDTLKQWICLLSSPIASITYNPNPVCVNSPVYFSGANSTGGTNYFWDFGDGTYSDLKNPSAHIYAVSGNYTVSLTVSNVTQYENQDCGCIDTEMVVVTVSDKEAIDIHSNCKKMLCVNDIAEYCTSTTGCANLVWAVHGGTIISGQGTTCINVKWNQPSIYPTSVTLTANCPNTCGNSSTLLVPVLYPQLPIQGPTIVCSGSGESYSLPALPGTFYVWSVTGGGTIMGPNNNHNVINIYWPGTASGTQTITCNYNNPLTFDPLT
ncbi:MAG: PKD domain-containing protein, partial [Bacteroidia bacterium]|nr:PKD domain-containing protein [Bacteroidia bacterium]